jgi:hypothetical protein
MPYLEGKPPGPVARKLEEERVVAFRLGEKGRLTIIECCDGWYSEDITWKEWDRLVSEVNSIRPKTT